MDLIDIHMSVWEHEFKDESYQSKWNEIKTSKLKEIIKAFDSLSFLNSAQRLFGSSKENSFKAFADYLREDFKNKTGSDSPAELLFQAEFEDYEDTIIGLFKSLNRSESFLQISCLLCSPNYTPPDNITDILCHLIVLGIRIMRLHPGPQFISDMCMDLSLVKLVGAVNRKYEEIARHSERELARTKKATAKKQVRVEQDKTIVYEAFYKIDIKNGTKLTSVVRNISQKLQGEFKDPPSEQTIRRYLENNPEIKRYFKPVGRFWIYQT